MYDYKILNDTNCSRLTGARSDHDFRRFRVLVPDTSEHIVIPVGSGLVAAMTCHVQLLVMPHIRN